MATRNCKGHDLYSTGESPGTKVNGFGLIASIFGDEMYHQLGFKYNEYNENCSITEYRRQTSFIGSCYCTDQVFHVMDCIHLHSNRKESVLNSNHKDVDYTKSFERI